MFNVTVRQSRTLFDLNSFREIKKPAEYHVQLYKQAGCLKNKSKALISGKWFLHFSGGTILRAPRSKG